MYKLCKTEESAERQKQLELALLDALRTQTFEEISVSDLCEQIRVPRKSFYRYFSGKDGALIALIDHTMMEFDQFVPAKKTKDRTRYSDLERFFEFWFAHRDFLDALDRNNLLKIFVERAIYHAEEERMIPMYVRGFSQRNQTIALNFLISGLLSVLMQWHRSGYKQTAGEMAESLSGILSKPIL